MKIADSFNIPTDLNGVIFCMLDLIHGIPKHFRAIDPGQGTNEEDVFIMWSCLVQRLDELGIKR